MDLSLFKQKLKELNPNLYVDMKHRVKTVNPKGTSGIYYKNLKGDLIDTSVLSGDERRIGDAYNSSPDTYISWVCHEYVPEGDKFDKNGKIISRGWRTIIKNLVKNGHTTSEKAAKSFGWYLSDYDMMDYAEKLDFERKYANSNCRL